MDTHLEDCKEIKEFHTTNDSICHECDEVFPFAVIEGSSGLGKTQSVFAVNTPCLYIPFVNSINQNMTRMIVLLFILKFRSQL